jgi:hypothetical protein
MAFAGSVLTKAGWAQPGHGMEIACAEDGRLVWKTITAYSPATSPAVSVKSRDICYTASPDQSLYQASGKHLRIGDVFLRHRASSGRRISVNHRPLVLAQPSSPMGEDEIMRILAFNEMPDGHCPNTLFHRDLSGHITELPVLSGGWERKVIGKRVMKPAMLPLFDMDRASATRLLRFGLSHQAVVCLNGLTADVLQWAAILSGRHAVIRKGRVVYSKSETRPVCINRTCRLEVVGSAMASIDVEHPFVREEGRIVIL